MRKQAVAVAAALALALFAAGCTPKETEPNGKTVYNHISMVVDETDLYACIGVADYVFVGTVVQVNKRTVDDAKPQEFYAVRVEENLKGTLTTGTDIEVIKEGGYARDGTLVLYEADRVVGAGLCEAGQTYIFVGYGQPNGDLLLDHLYGNMPFSDAARSRFLDYVANEVNFQRERFPARYEE